jgi:hypothetical protein
MAKKVTEEDLLAGVGGGFGNITQMATGRPIRDNPFRDTRDETPTLRPQLEVKTASDSGLETNAPKAPSRGQATSTIHVAPSPIQARAPKVRPLKKQRKTDLYTEKISTFLTPEMRDELEATARLLHRNRLVKGDSITVHTLIRSGVRVMTELLEFTEADVINSEEELLALIKRKLGT